MAAGLFFQHAQVGPFLGLGNYVACGGKNGVKRGHGE
jgi:hypothetical protein